MKIIIKEIICFSYLTNPRPSFTVKDSYFHSSNIGHYTVKQIKYHLSTQGKMTPKYKTRVGLNMLLIPMYFVSRLPLNLGMNPKTICNLHVNGK